MTARLHPLQGFDEAATAATIRWGAIPSATAGPEAPALRPGVTVHAPVGSDPRWLIERADGSYLRISGDAVHLLRILDGQRSVDVLSHMLGEPWSNELVSQTVASFESKGILRSASDVAEPNRRNASGRPRRLEFSPPFSLQLTVVRPKAWFERHAKLMATLSGSVATTLMLLFGIVGLLLLAYDFSAVQATFSQPLSVTEAVVLVGVFLLVTSLHEFGHAATLAGYGIGPRRMGVMLFYLSPAFFCDVTDGWRLPEPRERVRVALAGIVTSFGLAGMTALIARLGSPGPLATLIAVSTFAGCLFNLIPLIKLDGYIALMSHLDLPHLRDRSLQACRATTIRLFFGARANRPDGPVWLALFGLIVTVFTVGLVGITVHRLVRAVSNLGAIGAVVDLALAAVLLIGAGRMFRRLATEAVAAGATLVRFTVGMTLVGALIGGVLGLVRVPDRLDAGYVADPDGAVYLVVGFGGDIGRFETGSRVVLQRQGVVSAVDVGTGRVGSRISDRQVTLQATSPALISTTQVPASAIELTDVSLDAGADPAGAAVLDRGDIPLGQWALQELFVNPTITIGKALS